MKLGFIGTGNMAEAIIAGLLIKKTFKSSQLFGFDIDHSRLRKISQKYKLRPVGSVSLLAKKSDVIVLAVKPQQMATVLNSLKGQITSRHLVLSIAAGLPLSFYEKNIGRIRPIRPIKLVRLMPNTPALIGMGATVYFMNSACKKTDRGIVEKIFSAVGIVMEVKKESLLDAVTALSGSGPAYVYLFVNALIRAGISCGLSADFSRKLAEQTTRGAVGLLQISGDKPSDLIARVASKGGTTEAGLKVLKSRQFETSVGQAVKAAAKRARQLRKI